MVHGESSDDVDGSGASSKNGSMKLTIDRHTIEATGVNRYSVFSTLAHVTLIKIL